MPLVLSGRLRLYWEAIESNLILIPPVVVLWFLAVQLTSAPFSQFYKLSVFAVVCFAVFHVYFWVRRNYTTVKMLKAVDYFYLGLALLGVYGALDTQNSLLQRDIAASMARAVADLEYAFPCAPGIASTGDQCEAERLMISEFKNVYDVNLHSMQVSYDHLKRKYRNGQTPKQFEFENQSLLAFNNIKRLPMPDERTPFGPGPSRVFAYYILCIGLSMRMTKVSAEVFDWQITKQEEDKPPIG